MSTKKARFHTQIPRTEYNWQQEDIITKKTVIRFNAARRERMAWHHRLYCCCCSMIPISVSLIFVDFSHFNKVTLSIGQILARAGSQTTRHNEEMMECAWGDVQHVTVSYCYIPHLLLCWTPFKYLSGNYVGRGIIDQAGWNLRSTVLRTGMLTVQFRARCLYIIIIISGGLPLEEKNGWKIKKNKNKKGIHRYKCQDTAHKEEVRTYSSSSCIYARMYSHIL